MARIVDNLIAYRIVKMLATPFDETSAFEQGIVDAKGKVLKKASQLRTTKEKEAYTFLHRLVFNMKRIINRLPGGENRLKNVVAALYLIKEEYESGRVNPKIEQRFKHLNHLIDEGYLLVEEEIQVKKYLEDGIEEEGIANVTGSGVSTDIPVVKKKRKDKAIAKRAVPVI